MHVEIDNMLSFLYVVGIIYVHDSRSYVDSLLSSMHTGAILEHGQLLHFPHMANTLVSSSFIINTLENAIEIWKSWFHNLGGTMVRFVEYENNICLQQKNLENAEEIYVEIKEELIKTKKKQFVF